MRKVPAVGAALLAAATLAGAPGTASAQLKGHYVPGFAGLQSGTQPPPGISVFLPVYFYTTDDIRDDDGNSIGANPRVNASFLGPGIAVVTNVKILGGNFGASVAPLNFIKSRIEGNSLDVPGSFAFTDMYADAR